MNSPFVNAIRAHCVTAHVEDCDHYRIHGGLAIETDYILVVSSSTTTTTTTTATTIISNTKENSTATAVTQLFLFDTFRISKTYSSFRILVQQLQQRCDQHVKEDKVVQKDSSIEKNTATTMNIIKYCNMIYSMIDTQRTTYLGKVNFTYVKVLTKQRVEIINHVLSILLSQCYPSQESSSAVGTTTTTTTKDDELSSTNAFSMDIANIIHTFFLTDHVVCSSSSLEGGKPVVAVSESSPTPTSSTIATSSVEKTSDSDTTTTTTTTNNNPLLWFGDAVKNVATNVVTTTQTSLQPILGGGSSGGKVNENMNTTSGDLSVDTTTEMITSVSHVIPMSQRNRRSITERDVEVETLLQVAGQGAELIIDDGIIPGTSVTSNRTNIRPKVPNYAQPVPTVQLSSISTFGKWLDHNPWSFLILAILIVVALQYASKVVIDIDFDIFLLCIFGSFCIGLHTPRPMILGYDDNPVKSNLLLQQATQPQKVDRSGRLLLRQSMVAIRPTTTTTTSTELLNRHDEVNRIDTTTTLRSTTVDADEMDTISESQPTIGSPMAMFPDGAELGSHLNCWSRPDPSIFQVRGPNYLQDKKKIPSSSEYIFPCRGLDLFLTDMSPQNVGNKYSNILMGGKLREVPSLIINFRLPWGILLFYCEITEKFIPFLEASKLYGTDEYKQIISTKLQSVLNEMTPGDRTVARWCMNDSEYKNKTLKIVPVVVDGPWVVKSVVGGKPAIIGAKLPINYVYQSSDGPNHALYLEADLDIAASSAARGILSVARSYTQILTLNLGFVIQANEQDELPEQMLTGARLHGIDPLTAPSLPSIQDDDIVTAGTSTDEESE